MSRALLSAAPFALASLLATFVACSGSPEDPPANATGGTGSVSTGGTGPDPVTVCGTSKVGAPRLRRLNRDELSNTLNDVFPEAKGSWTSVMSADPVSSHGFDNDSGLLTVGKQAADELDRTSDALGAVVSGTALAALLPCSTSAPDAACATQFLEKYGKRLFRRALTADEQTRYLALFNQVLPVKGFAGGIRYLTRALVQSPHAIYRREVGTASGRDYQLSQHEIATELAYNFTGTAPTDALLAKADAGQLSSAEALAAEARALLTSEGGLRNVEKFFNSWLGYGRTNSLTKPNSPEFAGLREQMVTETRRFIGEVVVTQNAGMFELLTAGFSTPSTQLASFYGFPAPSADYAVTSRPAGRGIGILAQGAVLAALALPDSSSPTKRGVMVMERLLCRPRLVVPPNIPPIPAAKPGQQTTRQRYEESHAAGDCKVCHDRFDPMGFGFEHYDEAGRYRETESGLPINAASAVPGEGGGAPLFSFDGLEQLAQGLAEQNVVYECATGHLSTYTFGAAEACLGETQRAAFTTKQIGFIDYLASLATEPHFTRRQLP